MNSTRIMVSSLVVLDTYEFLIWSCAVVGIPCQFHPYRKSKRKLADQLRFWTVSRENQWRNPKFQAPRRLSSSWTVETSLGPCVYIPGAVAVWRLPEKIDSWSCLHGPSEIKCDQGCKKETNIFMNCAGEGLCHGSEILICHGLEWPELHNTLAGFYHPTGCTEQHAARWCCSSMRHGVVCIACFCGVSCETIEQQLGKKVLV